MKKESSKVKFIVCALVFLCAAGVSGVHADTEFDMGVGMGWTNYDPDMRLSGIFQLAYGYTSSDFVTETRRITEYERQVHGRRGTYITETKKRIERFDYDILFDVSAGLPFVQGGALFNYYLFTPSVFVIGVGVGAGYAMGYDILMETGISHGPYIRATLPITLDEAYLGLCGVFDYYLFEEHAIQIGALIRYVF